MDLTQALGNIDIYLLDQLLRGNIPARCRILDVGCGSGRNLRYFLREGFDVCACDREPQAVATVAALAHELRPGAASAAGDPRGGDDFGDRFRCEDLAELSFPDASFEFVICNAVLHFARDRAHFDAMTAQLRRVTRPGGIVFARLASTIGLADADRWPTLAWHRLPDGSDRFLVGLDDLLERTRALGAELVEPIKSVNVQQLRVMTNWVWRR